MTNNKEKFINDILDMIVVLRKEGGDNKLSGLTGEKNINISQKELYNRLTLLKDGYVETFTLESRIMARQGLFETSLMADGERRIKIPDWDRFLTSLDAFHFTNNMPVDGYEEED